MGDKQECVSADKTFSQIFASRSHLSASSVGTVYSRHVFMVYVFCRPVGRLCAQIHPVITNQTGMQIFVRMFDMTHSSSLPWRSHFLRNLSCSFP